MTFDHGEMTSKKRDKEVVPRLGSVPEVVETAHDQGAVALGLTYCGGVTETDSAERN